MIKRILLLGMICSGIIGCHKTLNQETLDATKYHDPETLSITGDFNGDGTTETLIQDIEDSTGTTVTRIPNTPAEIENDTAIDGYYRYIEFVAKLNYRTRIKSSNIANKPLYFGNSQGLYCLINVGNVNNNPGDEIALVIDYLDFDRSNSCKIYTLCNGTWKICFQYRVHEDAFSFIGDTAPLFKEIKDALEFRDGKWKYYDYMDMPYENIEDVGQMLPLKTKDCH